MARLTVNLNVDGSRMAGWTARLASEVAALLPQFPDLPERVLDLFDAGEAVDVQFVPAGRAGHYIAVAQPSRALLELVPTLGAGDGNSLSAPVGHEGEPVTAPDDSGSGEAR